MRGARWWRGAVVGLVVLLAGPADANSSRSGWGQCGMTQRSDTQCSLREQHYWLPPGQDAVDRAQQLLDEGQYEAALSRLDQLLLADPTSARVRLGRARALDLQSAAQRSNSLLEAAIKEYQQVLTLPNVAADVVREAVGRLVDRARFRGWMNEAAQAQRWLLRRFPKDAALMNELGVTYLMMGRNEDAKSVFRQVLDKDPRNGLALTHYGFVLKTADDNLREGAEYLSRGIDTAENGTQDGRFYFHLGDALQRLGRPEEAHQLYERAARVGVFLSAMQRSLYNVAGLAARPFWTAEETTYHKQLQAIQSQWRVIREEGLALLDNQLGVFKPEDEKLTNSGDWKQLTLYVRGKRVQANCARAPKTCAIVAKFPEAAGCKRGQVKFSLMTGGTSVWPHCGPTNCRLRAHLGLVIPDGPRIRVGEETRTWKTGQFLIFDDSFEHSVRHDGEGARLVLIVDFWHPDLTASQRASLTPI